MAELDTMDRAGGAGRPDGQREHAAEPRHPGQAAAKGGARRSLAAGLEAGGGAAGGEAECVPHHRHQHRHPRQAGGMARGRPQVFHLCLNLMFLTFLYLG